MQFPKTLKTEDIHIIISEWSLAGYVVQVHETVIKVFGAGRSGRLCGLYRFKGDEWVQSSNEDYWIWHFCEELDYNEPWLDPYIDEEDDWISRRR